MAVRANAQALMATYNKELGEGTFILASEIVAPERFTSGSLSLDLSLGGGWAANQWAEIIGEQSHGKTALTLKTVAANQKVDPLFTTLWVAGEYYDEDQAAALGVDNSRVIVEPTQDLAVAYDTILEFLEQRAADLVVFDSYPAMIAPDENVKDIGDDGWMAEGARLTGKFFRKVGAAGRRDPKDPMDSPWFGIFINQYRDIIGWAPTGSKGTTPGGKGKNYAFWTRLDVQREDYIKQATKGKGSIEVGQTIKTRTIKSKGSPPRRVGSIDFYFADAKKLGFKRGDYDHAKETILMGIMLDVIELRGAWFYYKDQKWQGKEALMSGLKSDPELIAAIDKSVREEAANPQDRTSWDEEDLEIPEVKPKRKIK